MSTRVLILAGGKGTRLAPYTTVLPKPLMPVGDLPILEIVLRQLKAQGFRDVSLSVGHLSSLIQAYCGDGTRFGVALSYSHEDQPLGTAGPIALVGDVSDPFIVMNGDILSSLDYRDMLAEHRRSGAVVTIATHTKEVRLTLGVLETAPGSDALECYREKPVLSYRVSMGIYVCSASVLQFIKRDEHLDLPDLINRLLNANQPVHLYDFRGYWRDIGTVDDYTAANAEFEDLREELRLVD